MNTARRTSATLLLVALLVVVVGAAVGRAHAAPVASAGAAADAGKLVVPRGQPLQIAFVNDLAPEHLEILAAEPFAYLGRIEHAGEILLGAHTPITIGNFVLGPNAVLPTGRAALTHSPLSVFDFMKRSSVGVRNGPVFRCGEMRTRR